MTWPSSPVVKVLNERERTRGVIAVVSVDLGFEKLCDINELAAHCNANPACNGFNTNGLLKSCTSGCEAGCCYDVTENVDLYIRKGFLPPVDWEERVHRGRTLFANPEPHFCFLPEIANGYLGTVAMSASVFQSGLFNGKVMHENRSHGYSRACSLISVR